jgi:hypothetical protein
MRFRSSRIAVGNRSEAKEGAAAREGCRAFCRDYLRIRPTTRLMIARMMKP